MFVDLLLERGRAFAKVDAVDGLGDNVDEAKDVGVGFPEGAF